MWTYQEPLSRRHLRRPQFGLQPRDKFRLNIRPACGRGRTVACTVHGLLVYVVCYRATTSCLLYALNESTFYPNTAVPLSIPFIRLSPGYFHLC